MAFSKKEIFSVSDQSVAIIGKILSHPARVRILRILAEKQSCICGEIVEDLPLAQSTVSQHLKELKEAGVIKGEIDGPRSCYCIDWEQWAVLERELKLILDEMHHYKSKLNCC